MPKVRFVLKAVKPVIYDVEVEVPPEQNNDATLANIARQIWEEAPTSVGVWEDDPDRIWALSEWSYERSYANELH